MADPSFLTPRYRAPSMFDFIGRYIGERVLSTADIPATAEDRYSLFSKYNTDPLVGQAEEELVRSLFKLSQPLSDQPVFSKERGDASDVFTFSKHSTGQEYKDRLSETFGDALWSDAIKYDAFMKMGGEFAEMDAIDVLHKARKKFLAINPDTNEISFKFREGLLGDVYVDKKGGFSDYWNIGLDKGEKLTTATNIKRTLAAPFTKPPTVKGSFDIEGLDPEVSYFYNKLFEEGNPILSNLRFGIDSDSEMYEDLK